MKPLSISWAIAAGVGVGVAYALSPFAVWFGVAIAGLFVWSGHGLSGRERRVVWTVLALAVGLRVLLITALFLFSEHHRFVSFFWDGDGTYFKQRAHWIKNVWEGIPIPPLFLLRAFDPLYGWTSYIYVLAYLQYLLGPAPYGVHLFNVAIFLASAVALFRLVRRSYGRATALLGFTLLVLLPTPLCWSISALKESFYVALGVLALCATISVVRSRSMLMRAAALMVVCGLIPAMSTIRNGGTYILAIGLLVGLAAAFIIRRPLLAWPMILIAPFAAYAMLTSSVVQARAVASLRSTAVQHIGNVRTEGHGYKLLDQRFYSADYSDNAITTMTPIEAARYVARSVASMAIIPLPWQVESTSELVFLPQQIIWYSLTPLAFIGLLSGLRRDVLVTCLFTGCAAVAVAAVALNSGNVGSMVRHRDTILPFVVWLSALGAVTSISRMMMYARD